MQPAMRVSAKQSRQLAAILGVLLAGATGGPPPAIAQTFSEFNVPSAGGQPFGTVAGPDGALWFTEFGSSKIGRISTGGTITEFNVTTGGSQPFSITNGPDGALWFTEVN